MSKPSSTQVSIEDGIHNFVVKTIADIGTQSRKKFGATDDSDTEEQKQLIVVVEAVDESQKGKPVSLSIWLTNSAGPKSNLAKLYKACGVKVGEDLDELLNKGFKGTVENNEAGRAKIKGYAALKKGEKIAKGFMLATSVYLDESFSREAFEAMPEFIQNQILKAPEFDKVNAAKKGKKK